MASAFQSNGPDGSSHTGASALDGVRVLDLTHHIAGPYCTKLLADFGADVIKVERPGVGDPCRRLAPFAGDDPHPEKSLPFSYLNTSKRGITLDLKSDFGKDVLLRLAHEADLMVESFSPRVMPSLGLDYETLRDANPGLVMLSVSNFGQTGPYRDYRATDIVEYALGGLMYMFGSNDREPLKHALHQAQFKAGTNAAAAAGIALFHQAMTGEGQQVDVSIQESMTSALRDTTSLYTYSGSVRQRQSPYTGEMPRSPIRAKDGYVVPIHFGGMDWEAAAEFIGEERFKEEKFATPAGRLANAEELQGVIEEAFSRWERFPLFHAAHQHRGLIYGVVQGPEELLDCPQYVARDYFTEIDHPVAGRATHPGAPFQMSGTPWRARRPAPTLGQHNQEVLCDGLGYDKSDLVRLRAAGSV